MSSLLDSKRFADHRRVLDKIHERGRHHVVGPGLHRRAGYRRQPVRVIHYFDFKRLCGLYLQTNFDALGRKGAVT